MKKRILSAILVVAMLFGFCATPVLAVGGSSAQFTDMPNNWSTAALQAMVDAGIVKGYDGKLLPNQKITRAEVAAMIVRAFGAEKAADLAAFSDVEDGAWYVNELAGDVYMQVMHGHGVRLYPSDLIPRAEARRFVSNCLRLSLRDRRHLASFDG